MPPKHLPYFEELEDGRGPRHELPFFRDLLESFTFAIIMALVIKSFLAEAYKVPTGSMEPTIHGAREDGDRILVDKFVNMIRGPRPWEIWVFAYPNNRQVNYVKRVVGVGPESLAIIDGDIYTSPPGTCDTTLRLLYDEGRLKIRRKPAVVQDDVFARYPRIPAERVSWSKLEDIQQDWILPTPELPGQRDWTFHEGLVGHCPRRSLLHFRHDIRDQRDPFSDVGPTNHYGTFEVGDLRLEFSLTPLDQGGFAVAELRDPQHDRKIRCRVPIQGEQQKGRISLGDETLFEFDTPRLVPGENSRIVFTNVDNQIELKVNDEIVATLPYDHMPRLLSGSPRWPAGAALGLEGAGARIESAQIYRDMYYRGGGGGSARSIFEPSYESWRADIPAGYYYVLGDNSPASNDSREWQRRTITFEESGITLSGDTMAVVDPEVLENRLNNPYTFVRHTDEGDKVEETFFVDDFGNKHLTNRYGAIAGSVDEPSPLIPRHLFIGRAFAVFLPVERMKLVR